MPARFGEALRFLTCLPIPGPASTDERQIARSMAFFPLVGLLLGLLGLLCGWLALWLWGSPLHVLAVVLAWVVLSCGLHLDGVADSCDALFSWRPRERKLEIMKDSRIGTMGALGLAAALLVQAGSLLALGNSWWLGALLAPVWGRWADIYGIFWFPAAREGGLGRTFQREVRSADFVQATLSALLFSALFCFPGGLVAGLVTWAAIHWAARGMVRTLGGLTGDTYGALCVLGECTTLLALVALERHFPFQVRMAALLAGF